MAGCSLPTDSVVYTEDKWANSATNRLWAWLFWLCLKNRQSGWIVADRKPSVKKNQLHWISQKPDFFRFSCRIFHLKFLIFTSKLQVFLYADNHYPRYLFIPVFYRQFFGRYAAILSGLAFSSFPEHNPLSLPSCASVSRSHKISPMRCMFRATTAHHT